MSKIKQLFSNFRIWIYIFFVLITLLAIAPDASRSGVAIRSVNLNSSAYNAGFAQPIANQAPMTRERIIDINGQPVHSVQDYNRILESLPNNITITIRTLRSGNLFASTPEIYTVQFSSIEDLGLGVYDAPKSNILLGLDLQGGTRVILEPEVKLSPEDLDILLNNMKERLNVFGLSDILIRSANDLSGNQFIIVEIAGANEEEVKELLSNQGKFEAKIGNETVFYGGKDIIYVCRTAQCAGLDPSYGCRQDASGWNCRFRFSITLSQEAAEKQADVTRDLEVIYEGLDQGYLSQDLDLYLDDVLVDTLKIGAELKGNPVTQIAISGSGFGRTRQEAMSDAQNSMKTLQTVLITGSLPVKLNIIKTDTLSPILGREFLRNAVLIGILSEIAVVGVVLLRYHKVKIALPIITIISSEILLILGISALFKQNIDVAGIAGIIVAIGTGVDDQIVITDEILRKESEDEYLNWKQRIKNAFFIVIAAYVTTVAAMIPLLFAGAGLLKGFAVTTIIGVTAGVFITRPAFAQMMKILVSDEKENF